MAIAREGRLYWSERPVWWRRQFNLNRVIYPDFAAGQNYAHDTGFAGDTSVRVAIEGRLHQTRPNALQLSARSAQTSHRDDPVSPRCSRASIDSANRSSPDVVMF